MILHDDELDTWRAVVRSFLERHVVTRDLPEGPRVDRAVWRTACEQLGVAGLDLPESLGGAEAGFGAVAVLQEECGRVLAPLPVLGSVVAATFLVAGAGDGEDLLEGLLAGSTVAAVVLDADVVLEGDTVHGLVHGVMDGLSADVVVLCLPTGDVVVVPVDAAGVRRRPQASMDLVRDFATISFDGAPARRLGDGPLPALVTEARRRVQVAVACEQLGGASRVLEDAVAYAGTRVQFGRVIGSFQALKHRCADLAIAVDLATSAAQHAVWAVQESPADVPLAVSIAGATCGPAYLECALENVHLHGGIGFTWEHTAHLHVRRAETDLALFGDRAAHHDGVLAAIGV